MASVLLDPSPVGAERTGGGGTAQLMLPPASLAAMASGTSLRSGRRRRGGPSESPAGQRAVSQQTTPKPSSTPHPPQTTRSHSDETYPGLGGRPSSSAGESIAPKSLSANGQKIKKAGGWRDRQVEGEGEGERTSAGWSADDGEEALLTNAEDQDRLERRKNMNRGAASSSSLPNIFETPVKKFGSLHAPLTPEDSPDHDHSRSGTETPTPLRQLSTLKLDTDWAVLQRLQCDGEPQSELPPGTQELQTPVSSDTVPISAPGSIVHFPTSIPDSPTSAFGTRVAASTSTHARPRFSQPLIFPLTPSPSARTSLYSAEPMSPFSLGPSDCPTPISQAFSAFSFGSTAPESGRPASDAPDDASWISTPSATGDAPGRFDLGDFSPALDLSSQSANLGSLGRPELLNVAVAPEQMSSLEESRYLLVWNLPSGVGLGDLKEVFKTFGDLRAMLVKFLATHGVVILAYWDIRHARNAWRAIQGALLQRLSLETAMRAFVSKEEVNKLIAGNSEGREFTAVNDGALMLRALNGEEGHLSALALQVTLATFGDLRSLQTAAHLTRAWIAEFFDASAATRARDALQNRYLEGSLLHVIYANSEVAAAPSVPPRITASPDQQGLSERLAAFNFGEAGGSDVVPSLSASGAMHLVANHSPTWPLPPVVHSSASHATFGSLAGINSHVTNYPLHPPQPSIWQAAHGVRSGRPAHATSLPNDFIPNDFGLQPSTRQRHSDGELFDQRNVFLPPDINSLLANPATPAGPASRSRESSTDSTSVTSSAQRIMHLLKNDQIPEANRINLDRLAAGLETRTTVMIKDIPNKLTRSMLLAILHSVVPLGGVDFCYLRMDFANKCNVGYGFVNFSSTAALLQFASEKMGRRWNLFSSEKVLQLSFANVQSKAALIKKFRDSPVMLQPEEYRPVILHSSGRLPGQIEPFPPPTDVNRRESSLRSSQAARLYHDAGSPPSSF